MSKSKRGAKRKHSKKHKMTPARRAALRKAQIISGQNRRRAYNYRTAVAYLQPGANITNYKKFMKY